MWSAPPQTVMPAGRLQLVSAHELDDLRSRLARGEVPADLEAKLLRLANGDLLHQFVAQNCLCFLNLLRAIQQGAFKAVSVGDQERVLRVLAYVRKDDDAQPDYKPGGFVDDQQEVRAALLELGPLLQVFKAWRLQHQVPGLWWN